MLIFTLISSQTEIFRFTLLCTGDQMIYEVPVQWQGSDSYAFVCFPLILNLISFYKKPSFTIEYIFSCSCDIFFLGLCHYSILKYFNYVPMLGFFNTKWLEDVVITEKYAITRNHLFMREKSNVRKRKVYVAHCGSVQTVTQDSDFHFSNVNPLLTEG